MDVIMDPAQALEAREIARYRIIDETSARGDSRLQQFYAGAVVLVTGGSGFLGKQLIEKLFRSCDILKIYMLLRTKKGKCVQHRIEEFAKDPVFDKLRQTKPDFATKIFAINGDITKIGFGLSQEDWKTITDEVTVIFHGAATISFTEPLKLATLTNVRGTREMLALGKACKHLKAYVHISTAYSHATGERIKKPVLEKFYDSPISPSALIGMSETLDDEILDGITPSLIKDWPNTYSFTKAVAEEAVRTMSEDLPVCIVRPAVVICSLREPAPGWIEPSCIYGPSGFLYGIGKGAMHTMYVDMSVSLDYVPVDLVNNTIIAAAREASDRCNQSEIKIFTVTGARNPVTFDRTIKIMNSCEYPSTMSIWYIFAVYTKCKPLFLLIHYLLHLIPAYIADAVAGLLGKQLNAVKLCNLVITFSTVYEYYLTNDWKFDDKNLLQLYWGMSPADRIIFNCNTTNMDWKLYLYFWGLGLRKYIAKDGLTGTLEAKRKQFWYRILNFIVLPSYLYMLWLCVYGFIKIVFEMIMFVSNFI